MSCIICTGSTKIGGVIIDERSKSKIAWKDMYKLALHCAEMEWVTRGSICRDCSTKVQKVSDAVANFKKQFNHSPVKVELSPQTSSSNSPNTLVYTYSTTNPPIVSPKENQVPKEKPFRSKPFMALHFNRISSIYKREVLTLKRAVHRIEFDNFTFAGFIEKVNSSCPYLINLFSTILSTRRKKVTTCTKMFSIFSILLNIQSNKSSKLQKLIGIALYYRKCPKKVFLLLERLGYCCSYETILGIVKATSNLWNKPLKAWLEEKEDVDITVDNIDVTINASEETMKNHGRSVHGVIGFFSPNRIPNPFPAIPSNSIDPRTIPLKELLYHNKDEEKKLYQNISIHILRILARHVNVFKKFEDEAKEPIFHPFQQYTSKETSSLVSEMICDKNPNTKNDVPYILDFYQKTMKENDPYFYQSYPKINVNGDQLTLERFKTMQRNRANSINPESRWPEFNFTNAEWHAKMNFIDGLMNTYYYEGSLLQEMANYLNIKVPKNAKRDLDDIQDFLTLATDVLTLSFSMKYFNLRTVNETNENISSKDYQTILSDIQKMVENKLDLGFLDNQKALDHDDLLDDADNDYNEAFNLINQLLILRDWIDSIRFADADRLGLTRKTIRAYYSYYSRKKYRLDSLELEIKIRSLPQNIAFKTKWERFMNISGKLDSNIEKDRFMEFQIGRTKGFISRLGSNFKPAFVTHLTRSVDNFGERTDVLEKDLNVRITQSKHCDPIRDDEVILLLEFVNEMKTFEITPGRNSRRPNPFSLLNEVPRRKFNDWAKDIVKKYATKTCFIRNGNLNVTELFNESITNDLNQEAAAIQTDNAHFLFDDNNVQENGNQEEDDHDRFEEVDQQELQELQSDEETDEPVIIPQLLFCQLEHFQHFQQFEQLEPLFQQSETPKRRKRFVE